jgi:hypothetical protein
MNRIALAACALLACVCIGMGVARGSGNGGLCFGEWEIVQEDDGSWSYVSGSYNCYGDCGPQICTEKRMPWPPTGSTGQRYNCVCMSPNGQYTFDFFFDEHHNLKYLCDGMGIPAASNPGLITGVECLGDCPNGGPPICRANETARYKKDYPNGPYYATVVCNCHTDHGP